MSDVIMAACDLHDANMLLKIAAGRNAPEKISCANTEAGRRGLIAKLKTMCEKKNGGRIVFAYEASGQGFCLHDQLVAEGIECFVLAPSKMARSAKLKKNKTDEKDADQILDLLRGHILGGNKLPKITVPTLQQRDDRELTRLRVELSQKRSRLKAQIQSLLKRNNLTRPFEEGGAWTQAHRAWLEKRAAKTLLPGAQEVLASLLRQYDCIADELDAADAKLTNLAGEERYKIDVAALLKLHGVGLLTALVFLTEMGDCTRFNNRRQVGCYLGVTPSSDETGERHDRKGHITKQGPANIRRMLCQAVWAAIRNDAETAAAYAVIVERNPKAKKIAVVAMMRRLGIKMWHTVMNERQKTA